MMIAMFMSRRDNCDLDCQFDLINFDPNSRLGRFRYLANSHFNFPFNRFHWFMIILVKLKKSHFNLGGEYFVGLISFAMIIG